MSTTIVYPFDPARPTGLHVLARQLVDALIASGEQLRLVRSKPHGAGAMSDGIAVESHDALESRVDVRWLPAGTFDPGARHRLHFALEQMARDAGRWVCFGIGASAVVGSLVARRAGVPCVTFVTASDVLGRLMMHPDEVGAALARSERVLCANPAVFELLAATFDSQVSALAREGRFDIVRPRAMISEEGDVATLSSARAAGLDHLCTTGTLGVFDDITELTARMVAEMRATGARRWLHVGTIDPRIVGRLASALALRGLTSTFDATGACGAADYTRRVRGSLGLLKPRGEVDTGLSIVEASRWGIRVSLPADFPFATDGGMTAAGDVGVIDPAALATRLLGR